MSSLIASLSFRKGKLHFTRFGDDGGCGTAVILVLHKFMQNKKSGECHCEQAGSPHCTTPVCIIASHFSLHTAECMSKNIVSHYCLLDTFVMQSFMNVEK